MSLWLVEGTSFLCSTPQQAPSHWEGSHQPPPTTAPSLPVTYGEMDQWHTGWFQHRMIVSTLLGGEHISDTKQWCMQLTIHWILCSSSSVLYILLQSLLLPAMLFQLQLNGLPSICRTWIVSIFTTSTAGTFDYV